MSNSLTNVAISRAAARYLSIPPEVATTGAYAASTVASPAPAASVALRVPPGPRKVLHAATAARGSSATATCGRPVVAPPGALVVTHDGGAPDLRPLRIYRYESEALSRISRGRYLSVTIWESTAGPVRSRSFKWMDPDLLSSVDDPAGTAVVTAPLRVRGWCQERGGGLVVPVEFRVNGAIVAPERIVRTARPDVAAAIPEVGDVSRAGYEAYFGIDAIPPGEHVLEVVFETADRRRVYPPRRFTLVAARTPGSAAR